MTESTARKITPETAVKMVTINGGNEFMRHRLAEAMGAKVRPDGSFQIPRADLDKFHRLVNELDR